MTTKDNASFSDLRAMQQLVPKGASNGSGDNTVQNLEHVARLSIEACRQASIESANRVLDAARELEDYIAKIHKEAEEIALLVKQRGDALAARVEAGYSLASKTMGMMKEIRRLHEGA